MFAHLGWIFQLPLCSTAAPGCKALQGYTAAPASASQQAAAA